MKTFDCSDPKLLVRSSRRDVLKQFGASGAALALLFRPSAEASVRESRRESASPDRPFAEDPGRRLGIGFDRSDLDAGLPRCGHTATALPDGHVLIVGGDFMGTMSSAEIFDPIVGRWMSAAPMGTPRAYHAAALLPDGRVLVTGGYYNGPLSGAEIYDSATDAWEPAAPMNVARCQHAAIALPGGQVIVTGGIADFPLSGVEVYDPGADRWTSL